MLLTESTHEAIFIFLNVLYIENWLGALPFVIAKCKGYVPFPKLSILGHKEMFLGFAESLTNSKFPTWYGIVLSAQPL